MRLPSDRECLTDVPYRRSDWNPKHDALQNLPPDRWKTSPTPPTEAAKPQPSSLDNPAFHGNTDTTPPSVKSRRFDHQSMFCGGFGNLPGIFRFVLFSREILTSSPF